jgi:hypothetical protein
VQVRFATEALDPPSLPGLHVRQRQEDRLTIEYTGPLPELLGWLSGLSVTELRVEPLGLNAVYHRYHGDAE